MKARNEDYVKILVGLHYQLSGAAAKKEKKPKVDLKKQLDSSSSSNSIKTSVVEETKNTSSNNENITTSTTTATSTTDVLINGLLQLYDCIYWFGDLNYRINGNRKAVDKMLACNMYEALRNNDQLDIARRESRVFEGFEEV